jgi:hypothetical protein
VVELNARWIAPLCVAAAGAVTVALFDGRAAGQAGRQQNACYPAQATATYARRILISDSVAKLKAVVGRALDVCPPAAVDGAKSLPSVYLTCYAITTSPMSRRNVGFASNTFGTTQLIVESPRSYCVSSSPGTKPPAPLRLTCYTVVASKNSKSSKSEKLIGDTFHASRDSVAIRPPVSLCTGSRQGSTSPLHLVCYSVESGSTGQTVVLTDQWGVVRASLGVRDRICIQSSLKPR